MAHPGGRPSKMDDNTIAKLEYAWSIGCPDTEACLYADIVPSTLYRYCESHPEFSERKELLKRRIVFKARVAMSSLLDSPDENMIQKAATDTLNRYDGKPKERLEMTGEDGGPIKSESSVSIDAKTLKVALAELKDDI